MTAKININQVAGLFTRQMIRITEPKINWNLLRRCLRNAQYIFSTPKSNMINIAGFEDSCHNKKIASKASITMKKRHGLFILSFLPTFIYTLFYFFYTRNTIGLRSQPLSSEHKRKEATSASFMHF